MLNNYKGIIIADNGDGSFTVEDADLNTRTFSTMDEANHYFKWLVFQEMYS